ncbi:MAG: hypothetical protein ABW185_27830, partial [Sedimenticola sp.]
MNRQFFRLCSILLIFTSFTLVSCESEEMQQTVDTITPSPTIETAAQERAMSLGGRRRLVPPELEPIENNGVLYREVRSAQLLGQDQQSGFLIAEDPGSREQLWLLQIYDINYDQEKEKDAQEIYFVELKLLPGKETIFIEDELGRQFTV